MHVHVASRARRATPRTSAASAPQAITADAPHPRERQLVDEHVVEVARGRTAPRTRPRPAIARPRRARAATAAPSSRPRPPRCRPRRSAAAASRGTSPMRTALAGDRYEPKRAGEQHLRDSSGSMPSSSSRICQPVAIDAFANCSSRTSRCERYTDARVGSSPRQCSTNTRSSPISRAASASAGRELRGRLVGHEAARVVEQPGAAPARPRRRRAPSRTCPTGSTSPITSSRARRR